MKTLVHIMTGLLLNAVSTPLAASFTVTDSRLDSLSSYSAKVAGYKGVQTAARFFSPSDSGVVVTSDGPVLRTVFTSQYAPLNYWRMAQGPSCSVVGPTSINYSGREYRVQCRVTVNHRFGAAFQDYPDLHDNRIVQFAIESLWSIDGKLVDPTKTNIGPGFTGQINFTLYGAGESPSTGYVDYDRNPTATVRTELTLHLDDVVRVTNDNVLINYRWDVSHGPYEISSIYSKMYMEQLDSNIELTYIKPDGSGSAVIVPNAKVNVEDTSTRENSNGQIKLKLGKTGFGTRTSRLRVTVEWQ